MKCLIATGSGMRPRRIIAAVALSALLIMASLLGAGCGQEDEPGQEAPGTAAADEASATPVPVATAMRTDIDETLEFTGTAAANDEVDVVAEV
jgi:multidrug efflux pump subunit AcrA (membrane-fusion protein)